jgi:protoheme IX farnesyltransferase
VPFKDYYELAKPGILYGNTITVIGGFVLGCRGDVQLLPLLTTLAGILLVIGSGCVFNNYIDTDIDGKMPRTKDRPLVTKRISGSAALAYGTVLGILGFSVLFLYTNLVATAIAALGFFFYVVVYSLWLKRRTAHGALIGSISGAVPPVVGYCAASGRLDVAAVILFLIMVFWQVPHFFAIAIRRADEYAAAEVPVMPVARGIRVTKVQMLLYIIAFTIIAPLLTFFGYTGRIYLVIALALGLAWLGFCMRGFSISDADNAQNIAWARRTFLFSLVVIVVLFTTMILGAIV